MSSGTLGVMPTATPNDALRARAAASNARWRWIFAALAVVIPTALGLAFRRQELRLMALADHGRNAIATVTRADHNGTWYQYEFEGRTYDWNVARRQLPLEQGQTAEISFSPDDPTLSRPVPNYSRANFEAEVNRPFKRALCGGLFAFFALAALLCEWALRKQRRGDPARTTPLLSPRGAGYVVATLLMGAVAAAEFDASVRAVQTKLFGASAFGLPTVAVVLVIEAVLFAPLFWMMPHLMTIVMAAQREGRGVSKAAILTAVATAGPEHARSKRIVIAGAVYFVALMEAWIAYAAYRGV